MKTKISQHRIAIVSLDSVSHCKHLGLHQVYCFQYGVQKWTHPCAEPTDISTLNVLGQKWT